MKMRILLFTVFVLGFIVAKAGGTEPKDIDGKKNELIGIVIHSVSKKPLKDVSITAYLASKKEKVAVTNEDGNFSFDELKPGTYKFIFEKSGFKRVTKEKVVVKADEEFQMNIEMIENNDFDLMPSPFQFIDTN